MNDYKQKELNKLNLENFVLNLKSVIEPFLREIIRNEVEKALEKFSNKGNFFQELLSIDELAKKLNVKKSWVYYQTWKADGIPHVKVGRYPRFRLDEVLLWLEKRKKIY